MASPAPSGSSTPANNTTNIINALANTFRNPAGEPFTGSQIATLLQQNMSQLGELAKQGKLNHQQIMQLKEFADKHKATTTQTVIPPPKPPTPAPTPSAPKETEPLLSSEPKMSELYAIPAANAESNPGAVVWPIAQAGRPTLTGGIAGGRIAGTPAQVARLPDDASTLTADDTRSRRKNTPGDQSMRRSIQDLVSSIDPNVKIEAEVEDLLLEIADEFIDSVTNFGCRLAKHRGGDALEVRDLQLHLERNHNIRIPGFASDDTRMTLAQSAVPVPAATANKKTGTSTHMTLRSHRLAQVQQAKREGKLL